MAAAQQRPKSALKSAGSGVQAQNNIKFQDQQARPPSGLQQRDEEVDDVIAKLNPGTAKRRDSTDSLNFRDSAFDPMAVRRSGFVDGRGDQTSLIQPIAVDPMQELGRGLG